MTANIPRYIIETDGVNHEAIGLGFRTAIQLCVQYNTSEVTLLVSSKQHFPSTIIAQPIGPKATKALVKGEKVKLSGNVLLSLESSKTFNDYGSYGVILAMHLSLKDMDKVDSAIRTKAVIYVPWLETEGKTWLSTWNPTVVGDKIWTVDQEPIEPEVEERLLALTSMINLSTGLLHPSDKKSAQNIFSKLKKSGFRPNCESIRQWALRNNWEPKFAEDLKKMTEKYFEK